MTIRHLILVAGFMLYCFFMSSIASAQSDIGAADPSAAKAGFYGGNTFDFAVARGDVFVQCVQRPGVPPMGPPSAFYRCDGYAFGPGETAQFRGPVADADEVELVSTREDGTQITKHADYDGKHGRSTDAFNLWVETVFQKPLLRLGDNAIRWTLKRQGAGVMTGTFAATVNRHPDLRCPSVNQTSWEPRDCLQSTRVCQDYFYNFGRQCR